MEYIATKKKGIVAIIPIPQSKIPEILINKESNETPKKVP